MMNYEEFSKIEDKTNLVIDDYLDLNFSSIEELPDNLTINLSLHLAHTQISKLPTT